MKKISKDTLRQMLTECKDGEGVIISGNTFCGFDSVTIPTLTGGKANPMQGKIQKIVVGSTVQIFQNKNASSYEAMVGRRLEAEGKSAEDFVLSPRSWGNRLPNCPIVHHVKDGKDQYYLEVIFKTAGNVSYLYNGQPIEKKDIQGMDSKGEAEQGGLSAEAKVIIRSYKLDSITRMTLGGNTYIIED
jgi:hypothetical protein